MVTFVYTHACSMIILSTSVRISLFSAMAQPWLSHGCSLSHTLSLALTPSLSHSFTLLLLSSLSHTLTLLFSPSGGISLSLLLPLTRSLFLSSHSFSFLSHSLSLSRGWPISHSVIGPNECWPLKSKLQCNRVAAQTKERKRLPSDTWLPPSSLSSLLSSIHVVTATCAPPLHHSLQP